MPPRNGDDGPAKPVAAVGEQDVGAIVHKVTVEELEIGIPLAGRERVEIFAGSERTGTLFLGGLDIKKTGRLIAWFRGWRDSAAEERRQGCAAVHGAAAEDFTAVAGGWEKWKRSRIATAGQLAGVVEIAVDGGEED